MGSTGLDGLASIYRHLFFQTATHAKVFVPRLVWLRRSVSFFKKAGHQGVLAVVRHPLGDVALPRGGGGRGERPRRLGGELRAVGADAGPAGRSGPEGRIAARTDGGWLGAHYRFGPERLGGGVKEKSGGVAPGMVAPKSRAKGYAVGFGSIYPRPFWYMFWSHSYLGPENLDGVCQRTKETSGKGRAWDVEGAFPCSSRALGG